MFPPISPETVRVIHEEKIKKLEREIELNRAAREMRAYAGNPYQQNEAWYARAAQWLKAKLFNRVPVPVSGRPETFEEPCPGVPC